MGMMDRMRDFMMGRMGGGDKGDMMSKMMEKFFADMTAEDKQKMMVEMMPKMMPQMMAMMGGGEGKGCMMSQMMAMMGGGAPSEASDHSHHGEGGMASHLMEMMPQRIREVFPDIPKDQRIDFALKMIAILAEQGSAGLSGEEKKDFLARAIEKVKTQD